MTDTTQTNTISENDVRAMAMHYENQRADSDPDVMALLAFGRLPPEVKCRSLKKGYIDVGIGYLQEQAPDTASKRHRQKINGKIDGRSNIYRRVHMIRDGEMVRIIAGAQQQVMPRALFLVEIVPASTVED